MEVRTEKDKVKVIVQKYDKYNLPVLTQGEDLMGIRHSRYLKTGTGGRISAEQFRAGLRANREPVRQVEPLPMTEPDPSLKN